MIKFVSRLLVFAFSTLVFFSLCYYGYDTYKYKHITNNEIYIWGDSQAYQGIDIEKLKSLSNQKVLSAARHGAGVYDFLFFVNKVPATSSVVISVSKSVLMRRKEVDRNIAGMSLSSLYILSKNNYSIPDLRQIISKNLKTSYLFQEHTSLYPADEHPKNLESIELFSPNYDQQPDYLPAKQNIIKAGVRKLIEKGCKVTIVEFPFRNDLQDIEDNSIVKPRLNSYNLELTKIIGAARRDTIYLRTNSMYDLTHLNKNGAAAVTQYLGTHIIGEQDNNHTIILLK